MTPDDCAFQASKTSTCGMFFILHNEKCYCRDHNNDNCAQQQQLNDATLNIYERKSLIYSAGPSAFHLLVISEVYT